MTVSTLRGVIGVSCASDRSARLSFAFDWDAPRVLAFRGNVCCSLAHAGRGHAIRLLDTTSECYPALSFLCVKLMTHRDRDIAYTVLSFKAAG